MSYAILCFLVLLFIIFALAYQSKELPRRIHTVLLLGKCFVCLRFRFGTSIFFLENVNNLQR